MNFYLGIAFFICILSCIILLGYFMPSFYEDPYMSVEEKLVNQILSESCITIEKNHSITCCASGSAMPGRVIKRFTLAFCSTKSLSRQEIRKILISSANILLDSVEKNKEVQQYLEKTPATLDIVQIIIYNTDAKGRDLMDPDIAVGRISGKNILFLTNDPDNEYLYKNEYSETYEEALRKILAGWSGLTFGHLKNFLSRGSMKPFVSY